MKSWNEIRKAATAFSKRWKNAYDEKSQAQSFLKEFFAVFGVDAVTVATFEHRVKFADGSQGYADCLWQGKILVEMKSRGRDLDAAFQQAMEYVRNLGNVTNVKMLPITNANSQLGTGNIGSTGNISQLPRAIVVSDFARVRFYDLAHDAVLTEFALKDFRKFVTLFGFMIGDDGEGGEIREQDPVNRKAAEKMARLHDAMKAVGYTGHPLEVYLVRLLFCLFAEDTGIFKPGQLSHFIKCDSSPDGHDLAEKLASLFQTLNTSPGKRFANLNESLAAFPYVNGGLFAETLPIAAFSAEMRRALLDCAALDWSKISPAIFGAMFQGVMDEKARHDLGAHYTSEKNILKLIRPLFLDALREEFEAIVGKSHAKAQRGRERGDIALCDASPKNSKKLCGLRSSATLREKKVRLEKFHEKIASLTFLDPACGCGNFLLIAYRELRRLEMDVLEELHKDSPEQFLDISQLCKVSVSQFYGIEIEPFPAEIAKVALWLMDHLCNMEVADRFGQYFARIPIKDAPHIVCANALTTDWPRTDYIMGNPPFLWANAEGMDAEKRSNMKALFPDNKNLDFVCGWYKKANDLIQGTATRCAFVSTNSITQGEQVAILWPRLNVEIDFAYRTFKWHNEAKGVAAVHCVIIGFHAKEIAGTSKTSKPSGTDSNQMLHQSHLPRQSHECHKTIFDSDGTPHPAAHINGYLMDAPDAYIDCPAPICEGVEKMTKGSQPTDGGNLSDWSDERRQEVITRYPAAAPLFRLITGSDEYINNVTRWCLWLKDASPAAIRAVPPVMEAVERTRQMRLASKKPSTRNWAKKPTLFTKGCQPESGHYIIVPSVSSEKREYIPIGFLGSEVIVNNLTLFIPNATLYDFGVLISRVHMAWVRTTAGRLEMRYRYSAKLCYNSFVWPTVIDAARKKITVAAQAILDARAAHPDSSLADLYDPLTMPADLRAAHEANDRAVLAAYGLAPSTPEPEIVAHLFKLYAERTAAN